MFSTNVDKSWVHQTMKGDITFMAWLDADQPVPVPGTKNGTTMTHIVIEGSKPMPVLFEEWVDLDARIRVYVDNPVTRGTYWERFPDEAIRDAIVAQLPWQDRRAYFTFPWGTNLELNVKALMEAQQ